MTSSEYRAKRLFTIFPLIGHVIWGAWMGWWAIYGALHKHRGSSHWPVFGTVVRVLWLFPAWFALWHINFFLSLPWTTFLAAFVGLAISDLGHWLRDYHKLKI